MHLPLRITDRALEFLEFVLALLHKNLPALLVNSGLHPAPSVPWWQSNGLSLLD